jgi:thymidylate kinase
MLHPFICIEGTDGAGKTAVAKRLAHLVNGAYYKTPPPPYDEIRTRLTHQADALALFLFYLSAVRFGDTHISALRSEKPVICDRYYYSTFAYHVIFDSRIREFLPMLRHFTQPDYTVILTVDENVRRKRLSARGPRIWDHYLEQRLDLLANVERELLCFELDTIDTTEFSVDDVARQVLRRYQDLAKSDERIPILSAYG